MRGVQIAQGDGLRWTHVANELQCIQLLDQADCRRASWHGSGPAEKWPGHLHMRIDPAQSRTMHVYEEHASESIPCLSYLVDPKNLQ